MSWNPLLHLRRHHLAVRGPVHLFAIGKHRNPAKRGLVLVPDQWAWSSFRYYAYDELGPVLVNEARRAVLKIRAPLAEGDLDDQEAG
jgi:hypothetical protein